MQTLHPMPPSHGKHSGPVLKCIKDGLLRGCVEDLFGPKGGAGTLWENRKITSVGLLSQSQFFFILSFFVCFVFAFTFPVFVGLVFLLAFIYFFSLPFILSFFLIFFPL